MLDPLDRALIRATQSGLPLVPEPYLALASALGTTEADIIARLAAMREDGLLRRIAAVPNHYALGYLANGMTVWTVDDAEADALGAEVARLPFVSHCYLRPRRLPDWPYNLFAMVHAHDRVEAAALGDRIAAVLGAACHGRDVLYSTRILKKTGLRLTGE